MNGSKSTRRTDAANSQKAAAANGHAQPESPRREAETAPVDAQTRHEMIAAAAYFLAEIRGFAAAANSTTGFAPKPRLT